MNAENSLQKSVDGFITHLLSMTEAEQRVAMRDALARATPKEMEFWNLLEAALGEALAKHRRLKVLARPCEHDWIKQPDGTRLCCLCGAAA